MEAIGGDGYDSHLDDETPSMDAAMRRANKNSTRRYKMKKHMDQLIKWTVLVIIVALPSVRLYADEGTAQATEASEPEAQLAETQAVQKEVDAQADEEVGAKRKQVLEEAIGAVAETRVALQALEDNKTDEALIALEKVTGKLALIVAREPELALAPVSVAVVTHDLYACPDTVRKQVKAAKGFLNDGAVQAAREVLDILASEMRIQTTQIPLGSYPEAIKAIVPLIDAGKIEEAKRDLQLTLNTLVVTEEILPLPIIRATAMLKAAEKLAEDDSRTIKQNEELADMIEAVRTQIELAQALGYGEKKQFKPIYNEIKGIEAKTQGSKSGSGFFDAIKEKLEAF